jgi:hypothetical protein
MTSVHVAAKAMASAEGWDSDGSLSWEDFFGKRMNECYGLQHVYNVRFLICVEFMASYVFYKCLYSFISKCHGIVVNTLGDTQLKSCSWISAASFETFHDFPQKLLNKTGMICVSPLLPRGCLKHSAVAFYARMYS